MGFRLTDIIIAVAITTLLCIILCVVIVTTLIRRNKKRAFSNHTPTDSEQFSQLRPDNPGENGQIDTTIDEKEPLSSGSESSLETSKQITSSMLESPVGMRFTTAKSPTNGKLKMFGEDKDYDIGITSF